MPSGRVGGMGGFPLAGKGPNRFAATKSRFLNQG